MTDAERVFYAILVLGLVALISLQVSAGNPRADYDFGTGNPCRGLAMADCGQDRPSALPWLQGHR